MTISKNGLTQHRSAENDAAPRLVDDLVERLQDLILSGEMPPGTPLRQVELAEQLGVSRTPLREALRILTEMGLLRTERYRRTLEVTMLSDDDIEELLEIREKLDPVIARAAARHGLPADVVDRLQGCLDVMTQARDALDEATYTSAHVAFHATIAEQCGSPVLERISPLLRFGGTLIRHAVRSRTRVEGVPAGDTEVILEEFDVIRHHHRHVLAAVLSRDPQRAAEVAERHDLLSRGRGRVGASLLNQELLKSQASGHQHIGQNAPIPADQDGRR